MAKKMMTEKERIEQWLTDLAKNNREFLSLKSLKYDGQEELSICDGTAPSGVHMYKCVEYIASVLDLPIERSEDYLNGQPQLTIEYAGIKFYQIGEDDAD